VDERGLEQERRWSYSHTVLTLCWFGWIAIYLCRSVLAPILPVVSAELGLSHAQAGMLETAYLLGYIVIKMPAGALGNRIGIKRTLTLGMVGYALATALNFLATGFLHLFVLRFLVGLFQGVHLPLANTLLSERFGDRQGRAIGFHESGPNVGNSIAYPLTVAIASSWGWRYAFLLLSLPAFVLAGVVTLVLKEERPGYTARNEEPSDGNQSLGMFIRLLVPLALAHAVYNLCLRTLLTFAPSYLVEYRGMGLATAGLVAMLMPAAGFFAKISSGFIAERVGRRNAISAAILLSGVFIFTLTRVTGQGLTSLNFVVRSLLVLPHHLRLGYIWVADTSKVYGLGGCDHDGEHLRGFLGLSDRVPHRHSGLPDGFDHNLGDCHCCDCIDLRGDAGELRIIKKEKRAVSRVSALL
jgi:predicted MFS family arabinose efflux permease